MWLSEPPFQNLCQIHLVFFCLYFISIDLQYLDNRTTFLQNFRGLNKMTVLYPQELWMGQPLEYLYKRSDFVLVWQSF